MNDALLKELLEEVRGRFYGKYRGTVVAVDATTMRLKASVPAALPEAPTGWCLPCVPYAGPQVGFLMLPEIGSAVWIEFEGGDTAYPIWTGCYWSPGEVPSSASAAAKCIVTTAGAIVMDTDAACILITDVHRNTIALDQEGVILTSPGSSLAISETGVNVNNGALEVT